MKNGRWQQGDLGPDGRRFAGYMKSCLNSERWISEDAFLIQDALMWLNNKMREDDGSSAAYRAANPEKVRAKDAVYRAANREKARASNAAWATANPEKVNARSAKHRAAKRDATAENADHGIIATFYATAKRLSDVTGIPFEVDHIVPLTATGGGGKHCHTNLRVLPKVINARRNSPAYVEPSCWPAWSGDADQRELSTCLCL